MTLRDIRLLLYSGNSLLTASSTNSISSLRSDMPGGMVSCSSASSVTPYHPILFTGCCKYSGRTASLWSVILLDWSTSLASLYGVPPQASAHHTARFLLLAVVGIGAELPPLVGNSARLFHFLGWSVWCSSAGFGTPYSQISGIGYCKK